MLLNLLSGLCTRFCGTLTSRLKLVHHIEGLRHLNEENGDLSGEVVRKGGPIEAGNTLELRVDVTELALPVDAKHVRRKQTNHLLVGNCPIGKNMDGV